MSTPRRAGSEPYYDAIRTWRDDCLIGDGSLFTPGVDVWSPAIVEDLCKRFIDAPDEGSGSFFDKFRVQLSGAPDRTIQLAAEMLFVHFVGPADIRLKTKRSSIEKVLAWMDSPLSIPESLIPALDGGFASTGVAFKTYRPYQTWQILTLARRRKRLPMPERGRIFEDPWEFKKELFEQPVRAAVTQRHALLHLLYPDSFEPSVSDNHKRQIVEGFSEYLPEGEEDLDRQLAAIRVALQEDGRPAVNFYDKEYRDIWDAASPEPHDKATPNSSGPKLSAPSVLERLYPEEPHRRTAARELLTSTRLARKAGDEVWATSLYKRRIRLIIGQMQALALREGVVIYVIEGAQFQDSRFDALRPYVGSEGQYRSHPSAIDLRIPVEHVQELAPLVRELHEPLVEELAVSSRRTRYKRHHDPEVVNWISRWLDGDSAPLEKDTLSDLEADLYFPEGSLETLVLLLEDKGQIILTGPPGTGKTFVARKLAEFVSGSESRVEKVQFHPSYAYEDFVEGYRPTLVNGQPGFALKDGPLKRAASAAAQDPGNTYVLLVDEINRGNLAKVFGELYYLLEYRDEALRLPYSEAPFSLPRNLRLIGTMNTADRSIALVDLALRRRFHFIEFFPDRDPVQGVLRAWLSDHAPEMAWLADVVDRANELLGDRDAAIGPSYFLRGDLDEEKLELVWKHSVLPFLAEQLYGEPDRLRDFDLGVLRSAISERS